QRLEHLETVHAGQADIQDQQVEITAGGEVESGDAVLDHGAGVPVGPQPALDEPGDAGLVLGDQDPHLGLLLGSAGSGAERRDSEGWGSAGCCVEAPPGSVNWGMTRVKVEPWPGWDARRTTPPWPSAMADTIGRPRPEPDSRPGSIREKRSKMRRGSAGAIPTPSSWTRMWISGPSGPATWSTPKRIGVPGSL